MKHKQLGTTGIQLSTIIFGAWQAGGSGWLDVEDDESIRAMQAALDQGITTFDTAEGYGNGHSEEIVGNALRARRNEVVICTKVGPGKLAPDKVRESCEASLGFLGMDVIDLYQIHWPSGSWGTPKVPIAETIGAMTELKNAGKIRAIGVSNFSRAQLAEALEYGQIDCIQPPYSLFRRQVEQDAMPLALERNLSVIAYSPLAQGLLTGKFGRDHKEFPEGDNRKNNRLFKGEVFEKAQDALDQLRPIAQLHNITLSQLALAWIANQPTCAIAGARTVQQATENAAAGDVVLDAGTLSEMDRITRPVMEAAGEYPAP